MKWTRLKFSSALIDSLNEDTSISVSKLRYSTIIDDGNKFAVLSVPNFWKPEMSSLRETNSRAGL